MLQQLRKLIFKKGINLENKRILFLRDGTFKEQEKKTLQNIAVEFNATPIFVDVIKSTPVRLFSFNSGFIKNPDAGTVYLRSDREATIVSYSVNNNFGSACPQPGLQGRVLVFGHTSHSCHDSCGNGKISLSKATGI